MSHRICGRNASLIVVHLPWTFRGLRRGNICLKLGCPLTCFDHKHSASPVLCCYSYQHLDHMASEGVATVCYKTVVEEKRDQNPESSFSFFNHSTAVPGHFLPLIKATLLPYPHQFETRPSPSPKGFLEVFFISWYFLFVTLVRVILG